MYNSDNGSGVFHTKLQGVHTGLGEDLITHPGWEVVRVIFGAMVNKEMSAFQAPLIIKEELVFKIKEFQ
jgi:hypothetical protein